MAHIALAVSNQARSRGFYETYFDFDPGTAWVAEDGVLLIEGPGDVLLALGETDEPIELPSFLHFGFRSAADAGGGARFSRPPRRRRRRDRRVLRTSPTYVSVKCKDPDGYVIEFAWEPDD